MGPKLLNALLCMHLHRVTMRAARKVGLIDRSMKHMNYELRGKNFTMCDWLGFSKEDNLYPNHVRAFTADELPTVPRRGFYYGLRCHADAVTSTANEQRDEDEASRSGLALPVGIPKPWLTTGALKAAQMSKQRTEPATGGGSASQPITPAVVPTVPTGHSFAAYQQQCASASFNAQVCKYQSLYGWKKLRFRMDQADIRAIQSDPVARDNPAVMQRRAFRLRGLMLPLSVASNLTKSCDTRQRSVMALNAKRSLAAVFANIQTPARPTAAQMAAPVVPSQPVLNPVSHTAPPPAPVQAPEPRQKRPKLTEQELRDRKNASRRAKRAANAALLPPKPAPLTDAETKEKTRLRVAAFRQLKREQQAQQNRILEDNT